MPLKIEITATNAAELKTMLAELAGAMALSNSTAPTVITDHRGRPVATMEVHAPPVPAEMAPEAGEADAEDTAEAGEAPAEAPKRGRGRPPKNASAPSPAADPASGDEKTPAELREDATKLLIMVFSRVAKKGDAKVRELQKKYGVAKFADVPDDRAAELLADAQKAEEDTR